MVIHEPPTGDAGKHVSASRRPPRAGAPSRCVGLPGPGRLGVIATGGSSAHGNRNPLGSGVHGHDALGLGRRNRSRVVQPSVDLVDADDALGRWRSFLGHGDADLLQLPTMRTWRVRNHRRGVGPDQARGSATPPNGPSERPTLDLPRIRVHFRINERVKHVSAWNLEPHHHRGAARSNGVAGRHPPAAPPLWSRH